MTTLRFTEQDRDEQGFVRITPTDVLYEESRRAIVGEAALETPPDAAPSQGVVPTVAPAWQLPPTLRQYGPWLLAVLLAAAALVLLSWIATPIASPLVQQSLALATPTVAPTVAPTTPPFGTPLTAALVAYFDYQQPDTATALEHGTPVLPLARIAHAWVLLQLADQSSVWVRWRDLPPSMRDALPDRATPTPLPTATPAPTLAPVFVPPPAPPDAPTPVPTTCIRSIYGKDCGVGLGDPTAVVATQQARFDAYAQSVAATATAQVRQHKGDDTDAPR